MTPQLQTAAASLEQAILACKESVHKYDKAASFKTSPSTGKPITEVEAKRILLDGARALTDLSQQNEVCKTLHRLGRK